MLPSLWSGSSESSRLPPSLSLYRGQSHAGAHIAHPLMVKKEMDSNTNHSNLSGTPSTSSTAVVPAVPLQSRAKTNSERGKEFRAKRKKYEGELETSVYKLRAQIAELNMNKTVYEKQFLDARHTQSGSLVQLIQEYFSLFRFGLRELQPSTLTGGKRALMPSMGPEDSALDKIQRQEEFLARVMDTDALVGDKSGPAASIAQWRMYTISHDSLRNEPYYITTSGSEEHPCIDVHTNVCGRISRDTFRYMFPGSMHNEELVQKFLHHEVVYKSVFRFQFTDDNRIAVESADIGIVEGLQAAGFALDDIAQLMQTTVLTPQCTFPEPSEPSTPSPSRAHPPRPIASTSTKLSLNFLLVNDEDEVRPDERVLEIVP